MKRTALTTRIVILPAIAVTFVGAVYLFATSPDGVVVSAEGKVHGYANVVRSQLQGDRFWREQLDAARKALAWDLSAPERRARREARIEELDLRTRERQEELYQRNPKARPSSAEEKAEALRDEADRIEQAELDQRLERYRLKRINELQQAVAFLEARSASPATELAGPR